MVYSFPKSVIATAVRPDPDTDVAGLQVLSFRYDNNLIAVLDGVQQLMRGLRAYTRARSLPMVGVACDVKFVFMQSDAKQLQQITLPELL